MNDGRDGRRLSRREALILGAGWGSAAWLGSQVLPLSAIAAQQATGAAPAGGALPGSVLKRRIEGRTFDVHAHVLGDASLGEIPTPAAAPFAPADPISEEQRAAGRAFLNRFQHDRLTFDSPEQEEDVLRRFAHNEGRGRNGSIEENAARLLGEMNEAGIDTTVVLFLDFAAPMFSKDPIDPSTERAERSLRALARVSEQFPGRFVNFAGIDLRRGAAGVPLLEKAVKEHGFKGCGEITTTLWQTPPDDRERAYPYYETAQGLGIPVMIDCTMDRGFTEPRMYEQVAKDFPKLRIGLGGAGIRVAPVEREGNKVPASDVIRELAEKYSNLYLDLDDWQVADEKGALRFLRYLRRALDGPARRRIMFGSDYPVFAWMYTQKGWIEFLLDHMAKKAVSFTDEELGLFFSRNALDYLRLEG